MNLTIATFSEHCVANPTSILPEYDNLEVLYGSKYQPTARSTDKKDARVGNSLDIKTHLITHHRSPLEEMVDLRLMFSPYPIAVRPSYPMVFEKEFLEKLKSGDRLLKRDINTIDRVITIILKETGQPHLHALCIIPEWKWFQKESFERMYREMAYANRYGMTWELVGTGWIKEFTQSNLAAMHTWCRHYEIHRHKYSAYRFAQTLGSFVSGEAMKSVVRRVEKEMNLAEDSGYMLFAVAAAYGYIIVDHDYELCGWKPIYLEKY